MSTTPLFDVAERRMAEASREAYEHIAQTLNAREIETFLRVCDYIERTGYPDVTGGELSDWSQVPVTSIRPRLTGLVEKGWLFSGAMRKSRKHDEKRCHPVWPAVPRAAIERLRNTQR